MGDNAEYETQAESVEDEPRRPLLCWNDGELGYIWDWEPGTRVLGVFADLHDYESIGTTSFLSEGVPSEADVPDGLSEYYAKNADGATHEVIVLAPGDIDPLADAAEKLRDGASDMQEELIAGMLEAMVVFMEAEPRRNVFVFARTL